MKSILKSKEMSIGFILVLLCILLSVKSPQFLTAGNVLDVFKGSSVLCILAIGMTLVIITAGIDVSVAAMTSASAVIVGTLMPLLGNGPFALLLVFVISIVSGLLMGLLNGLLVTYANIPSIVVTLGTLSIIGGMTRLLTNGNYINSTNFPQSFMGFADATFLGISVLTYMFIVIAIFTWYLLKHTRIGRDIFAFGGNPVSSVRVGISINKVQLFVYGYMGFLAGFAAIALTAYNKAVDPNGMSGFELTVIAAVVLGGANIFGGSGSVLGTLLGAILLSVINNGLTLAKINTYWQQIVVGLIILIAVSYDAILQTRSEARLAKIEVEGETNRA